MTAPKLSLKKAAKAAEAMQKCLTDGDGLHPSMVETLWAMFNDGETDPKVRLNIANLFARQTLMREQLARKAGLSRFGGGKVEHKTLNITIDEIKLLPDEQRRLLERVFLSSIPGPPVELPEEPKDV